MNKPWSNPQCFTRLILRGDGEAHVICADGLQALAHHGMRDVRAIAFAAEMAEIQMAQFGGHDLPGGFGGGFVR